MLARWMVKSTTVAVFLSLLPVTVSQAQKTLAKESPLATKQDTISFQFNLFSKTLVQLAEHIQNSDPERADLLVRAFGYCQEHRIAAQMKRIAALLEKERFGDAIDRQAELVLSLQTLLELLQSEDRRSEIEKEQQRIKGLLKNLRKIVTQEKDIRAGTERDNNPNRLANEQTKIARQTDDLVKKIDKQDAAKKQDGKQADRNPSDGTLNNKNIGDHRQEPKRTPGREDIEQARREMEQALRELKKHAHDNASGHQDEALRKLAEAKAKLEEILRQLREEERKILLATLEVRFRKMLGMQLTIYHDTIRLDKVPKNQWADRHDVRSRVLSIDEGEIVIEAEKAFSLLKEEGSSVAFPEAVEQIRKDMLTIAARLSKFKIGKLTQAIETDVIEALEEIIEAFQKEMEKEQDEWQQQQQQQRPQDPPLVPQLAELKMLRSLQLRINRRTKRLGRQIDGEQATNASVVNQLRQLAKRQARVQEATYDLVTGRNR